MNAYSLFEFAIVGLAVGASTWAVVRPWLRKRRAAAADKACGSGNSDAGCGGCGGCAKDGGGEQPIRFHR
jgi:hypothetical protein